MCSLGAPGEAKNDICQTTRDARNARRHLRPSTTAVPDLTTKWGKKGEMPRHLQSFSHGHGQTLHRLPLRLLRFGLLIIQVPWCFRLRIFSLSSRLMSYNCPRSAASCHLTNLLPCNLHYTNCISTAQHYQVIRDAHNYHHLQSTQLPANQHKRWQYQTSSWRSP